MMDRMREGANSPVIKVILGLIMVSFVFAGVSSYLIGSNQQFAAKVGDTEIGLRQWEKAYQDERNRMQGQQMGDYFNALMADPNYQRQFKNSVLVRLVNNTLLDVHAADIGMRASDEQIKKYIRNIPQFNKDGKFDNDMYLMTIDRIGYSPEQFAESLRGDITRNQLSSAIQDTEFALTDEIKNAYQLQAQKRSIRSYVLKTADFNQAAKITEEEIQHYYDANHALFMQSEQVKIDYVELSKPILKEKLGLSDEDAEDEFYKLQSKLADKAFEFPDTLDDAAKAVGLNVKTSDFISPETATGVLANDKVLKAVYSAEVKDEGLNSEAIQISDTDIIVVRVQDTKPAALKPLDSVKADVKEHLVQEKSRVAAKAKAEDLLAALKAGDTSGVTFGKTEEIMRNAKDVRLAKAVFGLAKPDAEKPQYALVQNISGDMQLIELDSVAAPTPLTDEQLKFYQQQFVAYQGEDAMQLSLATLHDMIDVVYPVQEKAQ